MQEEVELKGLLTPAEYEAARGSTLNAHYTAPVIIESIYHAVEQMGLEPKTMLEPAMGTGNFFGMVPDSMKDTALYGVELDSITGRIAKQLYPQAHITVDGFERVNFADNRFDLAVGNVPFGNYQIADARYDKQHFFIHDYFFGKTLDKVRPGGIVAFITSKGTLDKPNTAVREYLAERADLLGAVRLPDNAFKNAGTEVTSDIIFLQKRAAPPEQMPDWVDVSQSADGIPVNKYFEQHPEMVLGSMVWESGPYGQETACKPLPDADLKEQLAAAVANLSAPDKALLMQEAAAPEQNAETLDAPAEVRNFSYTEANGKLYYKEDGGLIPVEVPAATEERIRGMIALRDITRNLIETQLNGGSDAQIAQLQTRLNSAYDSFTAKWGLLNSTGNKRAFEQDSSYCLLCSLEVLDEDRNLERKADMFSKRTINQEKRIDHVDTPVEALAVSIGERAGVDLSFMAEILDRPGEELEIAKELSGVIFKNPEKGLDHPLGGWENADEYLSGNVRKKLAAARAAAEHDPAYAVNVSALEQSQPKDLSAAEIDVRIGATWIDPKYYTQFTYELLKTPGYLRGDTIAARYSAATGEWNISGKTRDSTNNTLAYVTYGTKRKNAYAIIEDSLNLRDCRVYDTIHDADGTEKRVLNTKETMLAQQKQEMVREAFKSWVWKDPERREVLCQKYNEIFNSIKPREYDGSHIRFTGMTPEIKLRSHQQNAVARMLYGGNSLLAHCVGAGKTFEIIAAAMEGKRLGLCRKNLAEMLKLPVPASENITVVTKPSEFQKELVAELGERAEDVRNRLVEPREDNMLKITSDGRKLALDQRLAYPELPDDPESKVNACVGNVLQVWRDTEPQKGAQLVFCDLSTPHGDGSFNVYDDIKQKLMAQGVPPEQIAFIHDAKTDVQKAELFSKVRKGQVRVLLGSTSKMGAGTNVQTRLAALHHLDCPWRPADIEQREGRILRQGNQFKSVKIFKYVTEGTFDAYNWGLIENKQKFIGQLMSGKNPSRSCEDVDEAALSYAEVKALASGDPRIMEKTELDGQVTKLKLLKANHESQRYALEDNLIKFYPQAIKREQETIADLETDIRHLEAHTPPDKEHFSMTVMGTTYTEKKEAGQAIIAAFESLKDLSDKVELGEYRGFPMTLWVSDSGLSPKLQITLKHTRSHTFEPGSDPFGNITRMDNVLEGMRDNLEQHQTVLGNLLQQMEDAKVEVKRPFPQEAELAEKSERLAALNVALNIGGKDKPNSRERQKHDGKTSIKRLLRRMGVESAASAAPKKDKEMEVAI